ncbi:hypothetical protein [Bacillus sp. EAC]|uniref:hypothetical protein n=1 Tax=Bacillus sp. EAC TaxID=1978338 RepID=UPI000B43E5F4|nr:hypothetical protein [Bacillus sp. EAC]
MNIKDEKATKRHKGYRLCVFIAILIFAFNLFATIFGFESLGKDTNLFAGILLGSAVFIYLINLEKNNIICSIYCTK